MIKGGHSFYGQEIGVLVFSQSSPRALGDPGHAGTFDFQVHYEIVDGKFSDLIKGSDEIRKKLVKSVQNLREKGIKAVVGDCGLMSLYQREMASEGGLMTVSSSLILVPLAWQLIGKTGSVGILTGHSELLKESHLRACGYDDSIEIKIQGMQDEPHFSEVVIHGGSELDVDRMRSDVLSAVEKLTADSDVRALVVECSNLGTFSADIYERFGIPVFDIVTGAKLLRYSLNPPRYY